MMLLRDKLNIQVIEAWFRILTTGFALISNSIWTIFATSMLKKTNLTV